MDRLDSRLLTCADCFVQWFVTAGQIRYHVSTAHEARSPERRPIFTINVTQRATDQGKTGQHVVTIRQEGNDLVVNHPQLEIARGDSVLWHADFSTPGFVVHSEDGGATFDSAALSAMALYSHRFHQPGEYQWVDANRGAVSGTVDVRAVDYSNQEEGEKWLQVLQQGTVFKIDGSTVTPEHMQILPGQTVYWLVEQADGISITDAQLLAPRGTTDGHATLTTRTNLQTRATRTTPARR